MKYSIITVNLNNRDGLRRTIERVVTQTCKDFEYIIIDGASTDGSVDVVKEYEERMGYWISEPDKGIYNAMNKGILHAEGEYLIFMNSGDFFFDNKILEDVIPYLDSDIVVGKIKCGTDVKGYTKKDLTLLDLWMTTLPHQATFFRKALFENGLYDEKYKIVSDWKFCIEKLILGNATFRNIDLMICDYDSGGISSTDTAALMSEREAVIRELFPDRVLQDYFRWEKIDSPFCELIPMFNRTCGFQKMVYSTVRYMIQTREYFLRIKRFFQDKE